jgi:hypothetical protein
MKHVNFKHDGQVNLIWIQLKFHKDLSSNSAAANVKILMVDNI